MGGAKCNTRQVVRLTHDKARCSAHLRKHGLPIPASTTFARKPSLARLRRELSRSGVAFPVVVKPLRGEYGRGVHVDVRTPAHALELVHRLLATWRDGVIVEQMVFGNDYRILVHNGHIVDVLERRLSIVGDGVSTVGDLSRAFVARVIQRRGNDRTNFVEEHFLDGTRILGIGEELRVGSAATILGVDGFRSLR